MRVCVSVCERETVCVSVCWRSVGWDLGESSLTGTGSQKALSADELACETEIDSQTENRLVSAKGEGAGEGQSGRRGQQM